MVCVRVLIALLWWFCYVFDLLVVGMGWWVVGGCCEL